MTMKFSPSLPSFQSITDIPLRIRVVDIGANPLTGDGPPVYESMMNSGIADVVGFEPNPDAIAHLQATKGANELYLPYAVGDGRRHGLNVCAGPGLTSLLRPDPRILSYFHGFPDWARVLGTFEVDTIRLDDVPETAGLDLVKIDVQGAELMILENATERLRDALVVHTEVEFMPLYLDQPLFSDVDRFLRQHGFMIHQFYPDTVSRVVQPMVFGRDVYCGLSQLVWTDAVFIKDFTRLERLSDLQILKLANILHDCYDSIDVVLRLLVEYDVRCDTELAGRYLAGLQAHRSRVTDMAA